MYYTIKTGMNYPGPDGNDVRAEPGQVRDDVPAASVNWLLADGHIESASGPAPVAEPVLAAVAPSEPGMVAVQVPAGDLAAVEAILHPAPAVPDVQGL